MHNRLRASWLGVMLVVAIAFAGCYPFQGNVSLLLTPVPINPTQQAEALAALTRAEAEAVATPESMTGADQMVPVTAIIDANSLRVRQSADSASPIVAGLRQGDQVDVVGRSADGAWFQIQIPDVGSLGWVSADFVTVTGDWTALPVAGETTAVQPAGSETVAPASSEGAATGGQAATPGMTLNANPADLRIVDGALTIPSITSSNDGWLVVHADDGGTFGPVIGYAPIIAGENNNVVVPIDTAAATETVYLMLHKDEGVVGTYEFPGADAPVVVDGAPVSLAYKVGAPTTSASAAGETTTPASSETVTTPASSEVAAPAESGSPAPSAGEAAAMTGVTSSELAMINTRSLRVRSDPAANADVVGGAQAGDVFPVAEQSADGKWVRLYFPDVEGDAWVGREFVDISTVDLNVKFGNVTVNTGGGRLRVRNAPSLDGDVVSHVFDGDTRYAVGVSADGQWVLLFLPKVAGPTWVSADYVTYQ